MEYFWDIVQIVFADIILSGDNALVIGMAAAGLSPELRKKAIFWGMAMAAGLRIFFAVIASYLISIPGILFIGGLLLSWVCWRFFLEIREQQHEDDEAAEGLEEDDNAAGKTLWSALVTITIADVSMSIDNVFAVAAIATTFMANRNLDNSPPDATLLIGSKTAPVFVEAKNTMLSTPKLLAFSICSSSNFILNLACSNLRCGNS